MKNLLKVLLVGTILVPFVSQGALSVRGDVKVAVGDTLGMRDGGELVVQRVNDGAFTATADVVVKYPNGTQRWLTAPITSNGVLDTASYSSWQPTTGFISEGTRVVNANGTFGTVVGQSSGTGLVSSAPSVDIKWDGQPGVFRYSPDATGTMNFNSTNQVAQSFAINDKITTPGGLGSASVVGKTDGNLFSSGTVDVKYETGTVMRYDVGNSGIKYDTGVNVTSSYPKDSIGIRVSDAVVKDIPTEEVPVGTVSGEWNGTGSLQSVTLKPLVRTDGLDSITPPADTVGVTGATGAATSVTEAGAVGPYDTSDIFKMTDAQRTDYFTRVLNGDIPASVETLNVNGTDMLIPSGLDKGTTAVTEAAAAGTTKVEIPEGSIVGSYNGQDAFAIGGEAYSVKTGELLSQMDVDGTAGNFTPSSELNLVGTYNGETAYLTPNGIYTESSAYTPIASANALKEFKVTNDSMESMLAGNVEGSNAAYLYGNNVWSAEGDYLGAAKDVDFTPSGLRGTFGGEDAVWTDNGVFALTGYSEEPYIPVAAGADAASDFSPFGATKGVYDGQTVFKMGDGFLDSNFHPIDIDANGFEAVASDATLPKSISPDALASRMEGLPNADSLARAELAKVYGEDVTGIEIADGKISYTLDNSSSYDLKGIEGSNALREVGDETLRLSEDVSDRLPAGEAYKISDTSFIREDGVQVDFTDEGIALGTVNSDGTTSLNMYSSENGQLLSQSTFDANGELLRYESQTEFIEVTNLDDGTHSSLMLNKETGIITETKYDANGDVLRTDTFNSDGSPIGGTDGGAGGAGGTDGGAGGAGGAPAGGDTTIPDGEVGPDAYVTRDADGRPIVHVKKQGNDIDVEAGEEKAPTDVKAGEEKAPADGKASSDQKADGNSDQKADGTNKTGAEAAKQTGKANGVTKEFSEWASKTAEQLADELAKPVMSNLKDIMSMDVNVGLEALQESMGFGGMEFSEFVSGLDSYGLSNLSSALKSYMDGGTLESIKDLGPLALQEAYQGMLYNDIYNNLLQKAADKYAGGVIENLTKEQAEEVAKQAQAKAAEKAAEMMAIKVMTQNVIQYALVIWEAIKGLEIEDATKEVTVKGAEPMQDSQGESGTGASTQMSSTAMSATTISGAATSMATLLNMVKIDLSLLSTDFPQEKTKTTKKAVNAAAGKSSGKKAATGATASTTEEQTLTTDQQMELNHRRALLQAEWAAAATQIGEGSNAISSAFYDRAAAFAAAANSAQGSLGGISAITDTDRFVLFEITRGAALSAVQLGLQGSVNLNSMVSNDNGSSSGSSTKGTASIQTAKSQ